MKNSPASPKPVEFRLSHVFAILRRRWLTCAVSLMFGAGIAVAVQTLAKRSYESSAKLLIMRKDARLAARGLENSSDPENKVTEELLATHMQMVQSRNVVIGALSESGLDELPSIQTNLKVAKNQKPADYVIENLKVSRGGTGQARTAHVLNVNYRSTSAEDARSVLDAIVARYQSFLTNKFQDVNQEAAKLIQEAQTQLADELEAAENNYEQFRQQSSNLMWKRTNEETTNVYRVRYDSILQEITTLQMARAEEAARLDALDEYLAGRDVDALSDLERLSLIDEKNLTRVGLLLMAQRSETESPVFQAEQPIRQAHATVEFTNLADLRAKERTLLTEFDVGHPEVINIRKQIDALGDFLSTQRKDLRSGLAKASVDATALFACYRRLLESDVLGLTRKEDRLKVMADQTVEMASNLVKDEIQGESLRREVQRKKELFDAAVDRLREINLAKDYGGFINEILETPEEGLQVFPKNSLSAAIGLFLAMVLATSGIALAEYRDRRFRSLDDLRLKLDLPVLGKIPPVPTKAKGGLLNRRSDKEAARAPRLADSESAAADAFRLLRSTMLFTDGEDFRQVLTITSPNPAEGKSTTIGNLAISLGQLGRKVLVIDCDLRRPSQHELFSVPNDQGLTTAIRNELDPDDFIKPTAFTNVMLLPRGEAVSNPAEFLATGEFARMVDSLRQKFDHILFDCPPVLPVVDVLSTAPVSDGTILVIRLERTTQLQAEAACASLRRAGVTIDGVVVNWVKPGAFGDEEYYGYSDEAEYTRYREHSRSENVMEHSASFVSPKNKSTL